MKPSRTALLRFSPQPADLRDLSGIVQLGNTLWLANDETTHLERMTAQAPDASGSLQYGDHTRFALGDYLRLPIPPAPDELEGKEVDMEGLAYQDGYLWLMGSHSLTRSKPKPGDSAKKGFKQLGKINSDGNRYLLARIPLVEMDGAYTLQTRVERHGKTLTAAQLRGDVQGDDLTTALKDDKHLQAFLNIPSKDNGLDIEGLAVAGKRLFLGLRGPVLRGWAVVLELEWVEDGADASRLKLGKIGADGQPYRKHFLQLDGLGVRDLCVQGADLLILAGPSMSLDGPVTIFRWQGGAQPDEESLVFNQDLVRVGDIPYGQGDDHAEGMALFHADGGTDSDIMLVYDSVAARRKLGTDTVVADIFALEA